jgi:hypothetical protein
MSSKRTCDNCGREVPRQEQMYSIRVEMFARVEPLEFSEEDLLADHAAEMENIIADMETMDPAEAMDQVFESYLFDLCSSCRRMMHEQFKAKSGKPL